MPSQIFTMIDAIILWFSKLSPDDWILFVTFLAILWTTIETRRLRKWQRLSVLLSIFFEQTKDWDSGMKVRTNYPTKVREIAETLDYDPKWAYSRAYHEPFTWRGRFYKRIKKLLRLSD